MSADMEYEDAAVRGAEAELWQIFHQSLNGWSSLGHA